MVFALDTILPAVAGGVLIGLGTSLYLMGTGRVAGISGIFGSVITFSRDVVPLLFLAGLLASPWLAPLIGIPLPDVAATTGNWPKLIGAGLLVGIGTYLGSGCTSGHGVCGLANFSIRGLAATMSFMAIAAVVVVFGFGGVL
jgi:hypothetical protein